MVTPKNIRKSNKRKAFLRKERLEEKQYKKDNRLGKTTFEDLRKKLHRQKKATT